MANEELKLPPIPLQPGDLVCAYGHVYEFQERFGSGWRAEDGEKELNWHDNACNVEVFRVPKRGERVRFGGFWCEVTWVDVEGRILRLAGSPGVSLGSLGSKTLVSAPILVDPKPDPKEDRMRAMRDAYAEEIRRALEDQRARVETETWHQPPGEPPQIHPHDVPKCGPYAVYDETAEFNAEQLKGLASIPASLEPFTPEEVEMHKKYPGKITWLSTSVVHDSELSTFYLRKRDSAGNVTHLQKLEVHEQQDEKGGGKVWVLDEPDHQ